MSAVTGPGLDEFGLPSLLEGCIENLLAVYDDGHGLFPYSTRLVDGRFVNNYEHPHAVRYTINTLLGLSEAARAGMAGIGESTVATMRSTFLERQLARVETPADLGLLTLLWSDYTDDEAPARSSLDRLKAMLGADPARSWSMQDLGWTIWGACAASRHGRAGADAIAATAFDLVRSEFVDPSSGLPRHSTHRYRSGIVSFGSLVYYLRAVHEYALTFDDGTAAGMFSRGVDRAIGVQGPRGEWPWMLDVRSGRPFDVYPVFSVHQDSMSMLFLLPALDNGVPRAAEAIRRSLAWGFGENELSIDFYPRSPFHAYRSIERAESAPRARRYMRSLAHRLSARPPRWTGARVRLNPECRSYHLGWILYAWSGRPEAAIGRGPSESILDAAGGR